MANTKYVGNEGLLKFGQDFLAKLKDLFGYTNGSTLMSPEDKQKLDNIDEGATAITVDSALSPESENPVQNKVINTALAGKVSTETGKGLSTNDYTTADKNKLSGVASGAQVNVIETVKVNNTALTPSSKAVNITVATGSANGTLAVNGSDVAVKGLGSAAYTDSTAYATAAQGTTAGTALQSLSKTDGTYVKLTVGKNGTAGSIAVNDAAIGTALNAKADASAIPTAASGTTNNPKMDGTAAVGTSTSFARADHVHPTDTSRAPLASPALTGTPTAPNADAATSTTQIATTKFVHDAIAADLANAGITSDDTVEAIGNRVTTLEDTAVTNVAYDATNKKLTKTIDGTTSDVVTAAKIVEDGGGAKLASPTFTGTPKAPTAAAGTNNTQIATTAFVTTAVSNAVSSVYKYKGTKATYSVLPTSGNVTGDVWNVEADFTIGSGTSAKLYPAGTNVAWTGSAWDPLGGISYSFMTDTEVTSVVDTIFA